jgi:hypothetical protein
LIVEPRIKDQRTLLLAISASAGENEEPNGLLPYIIKLKLNVRRLRRHLCILFCFPARKQFQAEQPTNHHVGVGSISVIVARGGFPGNPVDFLSFFLAQTPYFGVISTAPFNCNLPPYFYCRTLPLLYPSRFLTFRDHIYVSKLQQIVHHTTYTINQGNEENTRSQCCEAGRRTARSRRQGQCI